MNDFHGAGKKEARDTGTVQLIDTGRLTLRLLENEDVPALADIWGDSEVMRFCGGAVDQDRLPEIIRFSQRAYAQHGYAVLAVVRKMDGRLIGIAGCKADESDPGKPELIYHFAKEAWGHGYATESVMAYIAWLKENALARSLHASVMPGNGPSIKVLQKAGFVQKGYVQFEDTGFVDEPYFELDLNATEKRGG